jgi:hypothetical protein
MGYTKIRLRKGGERVKIYMDNCCLNRPFDDLTQDRVYSLRQLDGGGRGNYTEERDKLLAGITLDDIIKNVRELDEQ